MTTTKKIFASLLAVGFLTFGKSALADWDTTTSKDEMTGAESAFAHSADVASTKKMAFPYGDIRAWLGVGWNNKEEWAYIGFNESPNLLNATTKDGYNLIKTRIKWGDRVENVVLTQEWGASFIHFREDDEAISKIANSNSALLELNWYGNGKTYFDFSLTGSSTEIRKMRKACDTK